MKKGVIVVRTGGFSNRDFEDTSLKEATERYGDVGAIFMTTRDHETNAAYNDFSSIRPKHYRKATQREITAYHKGARHVKEVTKYLKPSKLLLI